MTITGEIWVTLDIHRHRAGRRGFLHPGMMPVAHRVIRPGDIAADGIADTGEPSDRIVAKGHGTIRIGGPRPAVQGIVGERRLLTLAIRERGQIAVLVIDITFRPAQRIGPGLQAVHLVIGVGRRLILRIGDREEIAVVIVGEPRETTHRILNGSDPVHVIVAEAGEGSAGIDEVGEPRHRVIVPGRDIANGISRRGKVAQGVIAEARRVGERTDDATGPVGLP